MESEARTKKDGIGGREKKQTPFSSEIERWFDQC